MKVPIYLETTLELLAVVEVQGGYLDALRNQRFIEFACTDPMPLAPHLGTDAMSFVAHYARFTRVTYRNAFAETFAMVVTDREHVAYWPRRVWPRQRDKRRGYKPTKAERKDKRQFMAAHPSAMTHDQVCDPLYRKLVHNTPRT